MGDVIEACEDGGFDIPATSNAHTPSQSEKRSSAVVDRVEDKPRRIRIQFEDDDDDNDDDDDCHGGNNDERSVVGKTRAMAEETPEAKKEQPRSSASSSGHDLARGVDGKAGTATELNRPEYKIYRIETPGEDPLLEIVVFLPNENATTLTSSGTAAAADERSAALSTLPAPGAEGRCREPPSVRISSDGIRVVVDPNPAAKDGGGENGGRGGGGGGGGSDPWGKCSLQLPQRVVPRTAMSFFQEGTLTVRAAVAAG
ncbi:unnamed protein product [Hapterophycus canaliculatus]